LCGGRSPRYLRRSPSQGKNCGSALLRCSVSTRRPLVRMNCLHLFFLSLVEFRLVRLGNTQSVAGIGRRGCISAMRRGCVASRLNPRYGPSWAKPGSHRYVILPLDRRIGAKIEFGLNAGDGAAVMVQLPSSSGSRFGEKSTAVGCPLNGLDLCGRIRSWVVNLGRRSCIGRIRARTGSLHVGSDPSGWFIIGRSI
jgi:hypothetical protein